jgi:hypothetical protein
MAEKEFEPKNVALVAGIIFSVVLLLGLVGLVTNITGG